VIDSDRPQVIHADRSIDVVLPAAGKSRRFAAQRKKIFSLLGGSMVWTHAARRLRRRPEIGRIVIAIDADDQEIWDSQCAADVQSLGVELVVGGSERVDSVKSALQILTQSEWIAVHDAARPLVDDRDLDALFAAAARTDAALLAVPLRGTVKRRRREDLLVDTTVDRSLLWEALTPQLFRATILRQAYQRWNGFPVTDDAQLVERIGHPVSLVEGSPKNLKITVAEDLRLAEALLVADDIAATTGGRFQ
jgi:2-C-methyl-D-erythritol 4-phosphate cytidylyltransferase